MAAPPPGRSFQFTSAVAPQSAPAPSLDLTASDGTGLRLASLSARIVVESPLAFTELRLVFQNPEPRQLEGRFRIGLPPGATVSRFAMRVGSRWQEGEVVERQMARQVYEDFLHRKQDPALLEHETGNEFSARIFPIEAGESKEIIVSYSHELASPEEPYKLPLRGLPRLGLLEIRAIVGRDAQAAVGSSLGGVESRAHVVEVRREQWEPDVDFELQTPPSASAGLRHGSLVLLRAQPALPSEPDEIGSLLILLDTSASRALGHAQQCELVLALIRALAAGAGPAVPVTVACFDQTVTQIFAGNAGDFSPQDEAALRQRLPLGATDLVGALRWAAAQTARRERVLLVSDGVSTAGPIAPEKLIEATRALIAAGVRRLDALASGGLRDDASLRRLVTAGLPQDGTLCNGDQPIHEIAARLTRSTRSGLHVEVPGAAWVWPTRIDGIQAGESRLVYADLPEGAEARLLINGADQGPLALTHVERPLLERAWISARIEKLESLRSQPDTDPDVRDGLRHQIIDLSIKHRVVCPYTALLVLETEQDYARFKLDRRSLVDILTVGLTGMEVLSRRDAAPVPPPVVAPPPKPSARADRDKAKKSEERADLDALTTSDAIASFSDEGVSDDGDARSLSFESAPEPAAEISEEAALMPEMERSREEAPRNLSRRMMAQPQSAAPAPPPPPAAMRPAEPPRPASPAPAPSRARMQESSVSREEARLEAPRPAVAPTRAAPPPQPELRPEPAITEHLPEPVVDTISEQLEAWTGEFRAVMELVLRGRGPEALARALAWRERSPGDVLALVALGQAAEAVGDPTLAARAYGSIIDLFPSRADLRRFAGERLARLSSADALELAIDTYARAVESRPDHPSGHRLLGMALLRAGRMAEGFEAIAVGQKRSYPPKFPGVDRILLEDLGLAAAAWIRHEPAQRAEIMRRLSQAGAPLEDGPSVRFVLVWETDANDVDFHIHDARGGHAYFRDRQLPSGGELYADITQGYGPECFTIRNPPDQRAYPYKLQAHYYSRGPMGYGMGALQIVEHDGQGNLSFEERPYIIMKDSAYVDLGVVPGVLSLTTNEK